MMQTILMSITFLALSCSTPVGAVLSPILESDTLASSSTTSDNVLSSDTETKPTPVENRVVTTTQRSEFLRLIVATAFSGKDAVMKIFTIENMQWLAACATVYILHVCNQISCFLTWFTEKMNEIHAEITAPIA